MVEDVAYILESKQPAISRSTSPVHNGVGPCLGGSIPPLNWIFVLLVRFRLPVTNVVCSEEILDLVGDLMFGWITDKLVHGTASTDIILQSIDELLPRPHWVHVRDQDSFPTKSCACLTPLSTAGVSEYTVSMTTASCLLGIFRAGFLDLMCFLIGKVPTDAPHCVVCLKVSLMVSAFTQPNYGLYLSNSGVSFLNLFLQA